MESGCNSTESRLTQLETQAKQVGADIHEIKGMLKELQRPRETNWIGVGSFVVGAVVALGTFVGLFLNMRLTPIEKDVSTLNNDLKTHIAHVQRELEWNYESQRLHHEFNEKQLDKVFERVFNSEPPKFIEKGRP